MYANITVTHVDTSTFADFELRHLNIQAVHPAVCVCVCVLCVYVRTYVLYRVARKTDGIQFGELTVQIEFTRLMTSSPLVLLTNMKTIWLSNAKAPTRQH